MIGLCRCGAIEELHEARNGGVTVWLCARCLRKVRAMICMWDGS